MSRFVPDLVRGDLPLAPLKRVAINLRGAAPRARAIAMNSTTSIRRSPPSYLATKGLRLLQTDSERMLGQPCRFARPDHELAKSGLVGRMDGFIPRVPDVHQPGKLIPSSDYPKKG